MSACGHARWAVERTASIGRAKAAPGTFHLAMASCARRSSSRDYLIDWCMLHFRGANQWEDSAPLTNRPLLALNSNSLVAQTLSVAGSTSAVTARLPDTCGDFSGELLRRPSYDGHTTTDGQRTTLAVSRSEQQLLGRSDTFRCWEYLCRDREAAGAVKDDPHRPSQLGLALLVRPTAKRHRARCPNHSGAAHSKGSFHGHRGPTTAQPYLGCFISTRMP